MPRKKTIEELEAAARRAEERAKQLRAQAKRQTAAEEAKTNKQIIEAVKRLVEASPERIRPVAWADVPEFIDKLAHSFKRGAK
jgi:uncharacterized protein with HEPN domain